MIHLQLVMYWYICIYYFIVSTWLVHHFENKEHFVFGFQFITKQSVSRSSTIPILKPEAVTGNLPDRLVTVGCSLSCQKEVLVEEAQFVPFKLHCPTSYNKESGLALGRLLYQRKSRIDPFWTASHTWTQFLKFTMPPLTHYFIKRVYIFNISMISPH